MTQATTGKYAERIAKGAAFLDGEVPGWRQRIELDKLELSSCVACVLGQVSGAGERDWRTVRMGFGLSFEAAERFGFALGDDEHNDEWDRLESDDEVQIYSGLTAEWRQYIEATR